jgi:hypothetical protein
MGLFGCSLSSCWWWFFLGALRFSHGPAVWQPFCGMAPFGPLYSRKRVSSPQAPTVFTWHCLLVVFFNRACGGAPTSSAELPVGVAPHPRPIPTPPKFPKGRGTRQVLPGPCEAGMPNPSIHGRTCCASRQDLPSVTPACDQPNNWIRPLYKSARVTSRSSWAHHRLRGPSTQYFVSDP